MPVSALLLDRRSMMQDAAASKAVTQEKAHFARALAREQHARAKVSDCGKIDKRAKSRPLLLASQS